MAQGKLTASVDLKKIKFSLSDGTNPNEYKRYVRIDVPQEIEMGYDAVLNCLLDEAFRLLNEKFPNGTPNSKIGNIIIYYLGDDGAPVTEKNNGTWYPQMQLISKTHAGDDFIETSGDRAHGRVRDRVTARDLDEWRKRRQLEENGALLKQQAEKDAAQKKINEFARLNSAEKNWLAPSQLTANPFVHEGKNILIVLTFTEMVTATEGYFEEGIVVKGIPKGLFTGRTRILIAGKAVGKTTVKGALGEVQMPCLEYLGILPGWDAIERALNQ